MVLSQHQRHLCLTLCHHVITHFRWKGKHASKCSSTGNHIVVHRGGLCLGERTMTPDFVTQVNSLNISSVFQRAVLRPQCIDFK